MRSLRINFPCVVYYAFLGWHDDEVQQIDATYSGVASNNERSYYQRNDAGRQSELSSMQNWCYQNTEA